MGKRGWNGASYNSMDIITPPSPPQPPRHSSEEKVLVILAHLSALLGVGIILPLIVYLVKKTEPGVAAGHAKEALNFHLSLLVYSIGALLLSFVGVGFLLFPIIAIGGLVFAIIAAVKASEGVLYRYPASIRFVP